MLKKVLSVSTAMAMLFAANSQDLTDKQVAALSPQANVNVKGNINDAKNNSAVGTAATLKTSTLTTEGVQKVSLADVENVGKIDKVNDEVYRVGYSEKGVSSSFRKKKFADTVPHSADPFAWGDFSWMNGQSRKTSAPAFDSKYFTGDVTFDLNSSYSFADPIDNTVVGSTAVSRNNELQLSFAGMGGDIHYGNVRGRVMMQFGTRATVVPRNDISSYKGQYDLQTIYRYISEAYAGYHWDKWHGINLDAGIFMSYIGLFSYNNFENWGYQPSFTSDNTPWFFNGVRLQTFPTDRLKLELWLVNGWQSYGTFNHSPGIGASIYYRPKESIAWVFNNYYGQDDQLAPGRIRYHLDYSFLHRYYNNPAAKGIKKAAFSITTDFGGENGKDAFGNDVSPFGHRKGTTAQNFISAMAYNRIWIGNHFAWTIGGGFMHNPGQYLVLAPTGYADTLFQQQTGPGSTFNAWDGSTTFEWDVNQNLTLKLEYVHRKIIDMHGIKGSTDLDGYFAGHGGVTGPTGYQYGGGSGYSAYTSSGAAIAPPLSAQGGWMPGLSKEENRIIIALMVRF
ncbi:outer membrane beta-barrel protein [Parasediminibacterium sp. JCM 36343]|uniref:outer membrane beta-barrel protein n=1 Tax=Parasediminibacterium sp. JCM 36343 TaxID=3374279 RepID=UPI00397B8A08